ncbi:hypothetical protein DM860_015941 [Cuscuta australis]|uniref:Uncharacterized protein n=1 Tax=Cuscuta australis TaxID=267555 RepID=A0A328DYI8_9ASTE|nr:hypothetical protein DM860_015941 [Cuscuta australis]
MIGSNSFNQPINDHDLDIKLTWSDGKTNVMQHLAKVDCTMGGNDSDKDKDCRMGRVNQAQTRQLVYANIPLAHKFKLPLDPELPISRGENYVECITMVRSFCALNGCKIFETFEAWVQRGYPVFELEISFGPYKSKFLIERSSLYIVCYMYQNK